MFDNIAENAIKSVSEYIAENAKVLVNRAENARMSVNIAENARMCRNSSGECMNVGILILRRMQENG